MSRTEPDHEADGKSAGLLSRLASGLEIDRTYPTATIYTANGSVTGDVVLRNSGSLLKTAHLAVMTGDDEVHYIPFSSVERVKAEGVENTRRIRRMMMR